MATSGIDPDWPARARVWLVLDRAASAPRSVEETTERAIAGGIDAIVCRLKEMPEDEQRPIAKSVRQLCADSNTPFVMSHFPHLAKELLADGIQLGKDDPPPAEVRKLLGQTVRIGYSAHSISEANESLKGGADYVILGPIYPTPAKLKYGDPLGLAVASQAVTEITGTVVCIGGITLAKLPELVGCGVTRVAAIAALQHDVDPAEAVAAFRSALPG